MALGSPTKKHARAADAAATTAETHVKLAVKGGCGIRLTSLLAAQNSVGKAWAHAFASGGSVARGALTSKTVDTDTAKRIYQVSDDVDRAADRFRAECLGGQVSGLRGARRRRRRR